MRMRCLSMLVIFVMFNTMVIYEVAMCECREEAYLPVPTAPIFGEITRECFFPTVAEFRSAPRPEYGWNINIDLNKIPDSATDIYYFYDGGRDPATYLSLTLSSSEEAIKFAKMLADLENPESSIPISGFTEWEGEIISVIRSKGKKEGVRGIDVPSEYIIEGPSGKWSASYWKLKDARRGEYYYYYKYWRTRFMAIDLDTNRIYFFKRRD